MARPTPSLFTHDGGALVFDAVQDASFDASLEFTDLPVEDGTTISDNAIRKPLMVSLELCQTQTPITAVDGFSVKGQALTVQSVKMGKQSTELKIATKRGVQLNVNNAIHAIGGALLSAASGATSIDGVKPELGAKAFAVKVLTADNAVDRVREFYEALLSLMYAVTKLKLTFKGRDYPNLVLTSVKKSDAKGEFGKSSFAVELREIRTVTTRLVDLPKIPKAKKKKTVGAQFGPPLPPVTDSQRRASVAAALTDQIRGR